MNRKGNLGVIILLVVFLIISVIVVVLYIYSKPVENVEQNLTINKTYYDIYIQSNALSQINYVLSNGSVTLIEGTLHDPSIIEEYKGVEANSTLLLYGWSSEYYYNESLCNVTINNSHCVLDLDRKALNYYLELIDGRISIAGVDGLIKNSFLCFAWRTNVADVLVDLPSVPVPKDLHSFVDKCYLSGNISGNSFISFVVHRNFAYNTSMPLDVFMIDHERIGCSPIGLRNASIVI